MFATFRRLPARLVKSDAERNREECEANNERARARVTQYPINTTCWQQSIRCTHSSLQYNSWLHPLKTSIWCLIHPSTHTHTYTHTQSHRADCTLVYLLYEPGEKEQLPPPPEVPPDHFDSEPSFIHVPLLCSPQTLCSIALSLQRKSVILSLCAVTCPAISAVRRRGKKRGRT